MELAQTRARIGWGSLAVAAGGLLLLLLWLGLQTSVPAQAAGPACARASFTAQIVVVAEGRDIFSALREAFIQPWNGKPDFVLFDTAPSVGGLQEAALALADLIVIPAALDHLALLGVTGVLDTLISLTRTHQWAGRVLVQPTFFDETTRESRRNLEELQASLTQLARQGAELPVMAAIHRATKLREASAEAQTIFEFDADGRAAKEYAALVWRVLEEVR